jgi:rubrerythrin
LEELTLEELIRYTVRIEQDSFLFYRRAARILEGNALRPFTDDLADFKVGQLKQLKGLLGEYLLDTEGSGDRMEVETNLFDEILENGDIPAQATARDVLLLSLRREDNIRKTFELILSLPISDVQVQRLFRTLMQNEEAQIRALRDRIGGV